MRIGFDASAEDGSQGLGLGRAVRGLLEALERRGALELVRLTPEAGTSLATWRKRLGRRARDARVDGLHTLGIAPAGRPGLPWVHTVPRVPFAAGTRGTWRERLALARLRRRATALSAPSRHVAEVLGRDSVHVIPWGIDPRFAPEPPAGVVDEVLLERFRLGSDPLLLCPGAVEEEDHLDAVLHATRALADRGRRVDVVVTGTPGRAHGRDLALASKLGLAGQVSTLGPVEDEELAGLYRLASVVPALSLHSGFGFPAAEALASGTPVLAPPETAQAELPGVTVVDAGAPARLASAVEEALASRERVRFLLPEGVREHRWERAAQEVEELWRELL